MGVTVIVKRCVLSAAAVLSAQAITGLPVLSSQSVSSTPQPHSIGASTGVTLVAPPRSVTDDYYGVKVVDAYRYMENSKDTAVLAWMKGQADYTSATLAAIPGRASLLARIRELDQSVPDVEATPLPGDMYLLLKRQQTADMYKLYVRRGLTGADRLVVDPEHVKLAASIQGKGKNSITFLDPSPDNKYVAVGIAPGGSVRDAEVHIIDIASGHETGDVMPRAFAAAVWWLPDSRSLVYQKLRKVPPGMPATEVEQQEATYLHVLGSDSDKDPAVFGYGAVPSITVDKTFWGYIVVQPGAAYALGSVNSGVSPNSAYYIEPVDSIGKSNTAWRKVADTADGVTDIEVHGTDLYVLTYKDAPRYKVLRIDARTAELASAESVVPTSEAVVTGISPAQDALYVTLLDGGLNRVLRVPYGPHPRAEEVALPVRGTANVATDSRVPGAQITTTSWTEAPKIYRYDPGMKRMTDTKLQPTSPNDDATDVESVEVKVSSYDGTQVPLSIAYPRRIRLDGTNPTLLDGYGAYGASMSPYFGRLRLAWHERGGVYAVCHVRGGGEYGEEWHLAGKGSTKPNTWRDFIACAQYLIDKQYTSPGHLAGMGTSAGGILIGRAITDRPDLFRAAVDVSGVSDMLRFETMANGVPNIPEFGSTKTEEGFRSLYAMSPYHHVTDGTAYPAVLLETGSNDPSVDSWQLAKMAARLQAATTSHRPVLLRVEYEAGHGGFGGTEKQLHERRADEWSFLLWQFGVAQFQPKTQ
jgi:prolyl oligopeptidase